MNVRVVSCSVVLTLLGALTPLALQACSSSNDTTVPPGNGADANAPHPDSGSNASPDAGGGGLDSSLPEGNDSAVPNDGAPNNVDAADIPDGGQAVTPGTFVCGATTSCDAKTHTCCVPADGGTDTCVSGGTTTCPPGSATIHCIEAADCNGGNVCCGTFSVQTFTANAACATGPCATVQFCRTNGECLNGQPCVVQTCAGKVLEMCGLQTAYGCK